MPELKHVMRLNAVSCLVFGALFALVPGPVAAFLADHAPAPGWLILAIGLALLLNGVHLAWASRIPVPPKGLVLYFSAGDFAWVIGSLALTASGLWITSTKGLVSALAVAVMVGLFGVAQIVQRKAMCAHDPAA